MDLAKFSKDWERQLRSWIGLDVAPAYQFCGTLKNFREGSVNNDRLQRANAHAERVAQSLKAHEKLAISQYLEFVRFGRSH